MYRLIALSSALTVMAAMVGCHHTAGICDCDVRTYGCNGCCGNSCASPTQFGCCAQQFAPVAGIPVEQPAIVAPKEMPKGKIEEAPPKDIKPKEDLPKGDAPGL